MNLPPIKEKKRPEFGFSFIESTRQAHKDFGLPWDITKLSEIQPENFTDEYLDKLFTTILDNNTDNYILVNPDIFKQLFQDYREEHHRLYSLISDKFYDFTLVNSQKPEVLFTAGSTGGGKTEIILQSIIDGGYEGIVVDGTLANFDRAKKKIQEALEVGKKIRIESVLPDPRNAYRFVRLRERLTGRPIPREVFIRKYLEFKTSFMDLMTHFGNRVKWALSDISQLPDENDLLTYIRYTDPNVIISVIHSDPYDESKLKEILDK